MSPDGVPLLNVSNFENTPLTGTQQSPHSLHPHRWQNKASHPNGGVTIPQAMKLSINSGVPVRTPSRQSEDSYFDADHRKRRRQSSSPSESGTEADDEKEEILLGLPAPPNRLRKGLKGANSSGTASPLLTPSYLDQEPRRLVLKAQSDHRPNLHSQDYTDEETVKLREKFIRRRRAELIRRISESVLIGIIGIITCSGDSGLLTISGIHGKPPYTNTPEQTEIGYREWALIGHAAVVMSIYALYPLSILFKNQTLNLSVNRSRFYIHIPAAFDPAPLLYPVLLPVFVALSLSKTISISLIPNLVLSVASIPSRIIPFNKDVPWYSSMQWLLSSVPIFVSQWSHPDSDGGRPDPRTFASDRSVDEKMILIYPLHQALLPVLGYLTTTSLLPAELQLLSVSMIGLLLQSQSPQALILQCLLWIGGLSIFLLCGKVLSWEVALARIPSWRFRKSRTKVLDRSILLSAINDSFNRRSSNRGLASANSSDSEASGTRGFRRSKNHARQKSHHKTKEDTCRTGADARGASRQLSNFSSVSVSKNIGQSRTLDLDCNLEAFTFDPNSDRRRRYTLPSHIESPAKHSSTSIPKSTQIAQSMKIKSWSLRSFTKAQATVIKGGCALYVYAVTSTVIATKIRTYVGRYALSGQEPVGWALAYLLGDLLPFRHLVIDSGLDGWIPLPRHNFSDSSYGIYDNQNVQDHIIRANARLSICAYCVFIIVSGLAIVFRLSAIAEVDTRRKVFHGMMVVMFLPTIFVDPTFVSLAFTIILAIFLLLDLFRASQLPPLSQPLTYFLAPYVDGRDHRGPVIVSHIFLLIGCAIPLWLSLAAIERTGKGPWEGWDVRQREVSMVSGVVCVGMGDAAASLIGRRYGRRRWCWSGGKSLEGSLAFAVAVTSGLCFARLWLLNGNWHGDSGDPWLTTLGKSSVAATGASLTEAILTGGNDNVIVPVILWLLVRGLRI